MGNIELKWVKKTLRITDTMLQHFITNVEFYENFNCSLIIFNEFFKLNEDMSSPELDEAN